MAPARSTVPWTPLQRTVSPSTSKAPLHEKVRCQMSGIVSMAAAAVTILKMEPGVRVALKNRLTYTPV